MKFVSIIMGSKSDYGVMEECAKTLEKFGVMYELIVSSAHRSPARTHEYVKNAEVKGAKVFICAAGMAAHLAGVLAAHTTLPVIGIPCKGASFDGLDALLSTVQMPKGIPVATVAVDGAENAGILAAQILGVYDETIANKLSKTKEKMANEVKEKDEKLQVEIWWKM